MTGYRKDTIYVLVRDAEKGFRLEKRAGRIAWDMDIHGEQFGFYRLPSGAWSAIDLATGLMIVNKSGTFDQIAKAFFDMLPRIKAARETASYREAVERFDKLHYELTAATVF